MIVVASTQRNGHAIPWYLESYGAPLAGTLVPVWYEDLLVDPRPTAATYCFTDLELLTDAELARAAEVSESLVARGCRVLNDPARTLCRFRLLRTLHDSGVNVFDVWRAREPRCPASRPVFLRGEHDHDGRRSGLLRGRADLAAAIDALAAQGVDVDGLLVVEWCDTAGADGIYRKYSAFVVGATVLARHLMFSTDWQVKEAELRTEDLLAEERAYVAANPHEAELRAIFSTAGVEYGRIDYAMLDGRIQVWEINTNPTIVKPAWSQPRDEARTGLAGIVTSGATVARRALRPVGRVPAVSRYRKRRIEERAARNPRAAVHREFARRLQTAWEMVDDGTPAHPDAC